MSGPLVATDRPLGSFCGVWKRCLQTRVFGTFALAKDANAIVVIDDYSDEVADGRRPGVAAAASAPRFRWSFGRSIDSVRTGYSVEPLFDVAPAAPGSSPRVVPLRISFAGTDCLGTYQPDLGLLMVHLVGPGTTTATIVYRALDDDTLAVSITEVPAPAGASGATAKAASLQYGFMFRQRS